MPCNVHYLRTQRLVGPGCRGPAGKLDLLVPAPGPAPGPRHQRSFSRTCSIRALGCLPIVLASHKLFMKRNH